MALEQELNKEEKITKLTQLKKDLLMEIYRLCIVAGIETDSFEYSDYVLDDTGRQAGGDTMYVLKKNCSTVVAIDRKIESIQNA